jgi:aspartate aminotransferase
MARGIKMTTPRLSSFAQTLVTETAFDVLALAKALKAKGKQVIELQIGDSPFNSTASALKEGVRAIEQGMTHYCPSPGLPTFRQTIANFLTKELNTTISAAEVVVASGAKVFEQLFCEAFLDPGDEVLVFTPHFPTYPPNISRRGGHMVLAPLRQEQDFRPDIIHVRSFAKRPKARAVFLNSPHNPTGGVATRQDLEDLGQALAGTDIALFSDEPYCHMVWRGEHVSPLQVPSLRDRTVACYTFSKSYSMSGWRLGYAVAPPPIADRLARMINTAFSCTPPFVQLAGQAALENDTTERDDQMDQFHRKVQVLVQALRKVDGVQVLDPAGTFYVFPRVTDICQRLQITSHGLALFLLEAADDNQGVACLGGECFGEAGQGFLRFSCAEPDDQLVRAVDFLAEAVTRTDRVAKFLQERPKYRLAPQHKA